MHIGMAMSAIVRVTAAIESANHEVEAVRESARSNRAVLLPTQGCSLCKEKYPLAGALMDERMNRKARQKEEWLSPRKSRETPSFRRGLA
jgi:hypothetical protein